MERRVLIVEDDPVIQSQLQTLLGTGRKRWSGLDRNGST